MLNKYLSLVALNTKIINQDVRKNSGKKVANKSSRSVLAHKTMINRYELGWLLTWPCSLAGVFATKF